MKLQYSSISLYQIKYNSTHCRIKIQPIMLNLTNSLFIKYINPDESSGPEICVYMCICVDYSWVSWGQIGRIFDNVPSWPACDCFQYCQDPRWPSWDLVTGVLAGPVPPVAQWQDRWWPGQCHTCGRAGSPCRPPAGRAATVESWTLGHYKLVPCLCL